MEEDDFSASAARKKINFAALQEDHYAILGLENLRHAATESEIKKKYRQLVLVHHPDKAESQLDEAASEETFRAIQKAYDILMDPEKRREYDSMDAPVEETFPTLSTLEQMSEVDFYKNVGDVFRRVARWSKNPEVPTLGSAETPVAEVKHFYLWWLQSYESWRTFKHEDMYDVNEAENRGERRWMERQNEKLTREMKKKETSQLSDFVKNAQKADPRLRRAAEEKMAKKQAKKQAQLERKESQQMDQQALNQQEQERLEQEERVALAEREAAKKEKAKEARRRKEAQKNFRLVCQDWLGGESDEKICTLEHTEMILTDFSVDELRALTAVIREKGKAAIFCEYKKAVDAVLEKRRGLLAPRPASSSATEDSSDKDPVSGLPKSSEWSLEELAHLARATNKFPGGYANRWELIMAELDHHGIRKSLLDVQTQAVDLKRGKKASAVINESKVNATMMEKVSKNKLQADAPSYNVNAIAGDSNIWTVSQMKQLQEGLSAVPKDTSNRFEVIAKEFVPGKSTEQCYEKFNALVAEAKAKKKAAAEGAVAQGADEWTLEQQKQLEQGLRLVPSSDPERWDKIASGVTGKTKKQVIARYKQLVKEMKSKK